MNFYLYETASSSIRSKIKKEKKELAHFGIDFNKNGWQNAWLNLIYKNAVSLDVTFPIVIMEDEYISNPIGFMPESSELVKSILDINFEGQIETLHSPYDVFSVLVPKDVEFSGHKIKGIFVGIKTLDEVESDFKSYCKKYNANEAKGMLQIAGESISHNKNKMLFISYTDPLSNSGGRIVFQSMVNDLSGLLQSEGINDYSKKMKMIGGSDCLSIGLTDQDREIQYEIAKFITSFLIYITANNKNAVKNVFSIKAVDMPEYKKSPRILKCSTIKDLHKGLKKRPHYRQLKHEKFYRKEEYCNWKIGSRWVPVNMSLKEVVEIK